MNPATWLEFADKNGAYAVSFLVLCAAIYFFARWLAPIFEGWSDAAKKIVISYAEATSAMATEIPKHTQQLDVIVTEVHDVARSIDGVVRTVDHNHEMLIQIHGHVIQRHPFDSHEDGR